MTTEKGADHGVGVGRARRSRMDEGQLGAMLADCSVVGVRTIPKTSRQCHASKGTVADFTPPDDHSAFRARVRDRGMPLDRFVAAHLDERVTK
jgi:hypothetical protein